MYKPRNWGLLIVAATTIGCIESTMVIHLKSDGSGTVVAEECMSPQMTAMIAQFGQAVAGTGTVAAADDPLGMFKDQIERRTKELGGKVRLVKREPATNAAGWAGFRLTYAFDDICQLALPISGSGADQAEDDPKSATHFRVQFERGRPTVLRLLPPAVPAQPATEPVSPVDVNNAQMATVMAPMMAGLRIATEIRFDGHIISAEGVEINPDRRSVTLFDIAMDKLFGNAQAMQVLMDRSISDIEKTRRLRSLNVAGVRVADTSRPIVVKFQ